MYRQPQWDINGFNSRSYLTLTVIFVFAIIEGHHVYMCTRYFIKTAASHSLSAFFMNYFGVSPCISITNISHIYLKKQNHKIYVKGLLFSIFKTFEHGGNIQMLSELRI